MSAKRIGYWSRVCGLTLDDVLGDDDLAPFVAGPAEQEDFRRGWIDADHELREERLSDLKARLREQ